MRSTKGFSNQSISVLVSRTLKTVGAIIFLATLLDILILPMPYNIGDRQWQVSFVTQMVDRGIVPLVGIVLFLTGFWVDSNADLAPERKSTMLDPRFWACVLSSILGLLFLLMFPLHLNNVRLGNQEAVARINEQATQAETQILGNQLNADIAAQRQQIQQLLGATDEQVKQLQDSGQLTQEQADLIRRFKADPKALDPFLQEREAEARTQVQTRIGVEKEEALKNAQTEALKSGLRVGISSLLLAIGFAVVGWTGLRSLGRE